MSTALDVAAAELAQLRREVAELRLRAPPLPPRLDELRDGAEVSVELLEALRRAQHAGTLRYRPGELREVFVVDRTGRRQLCFFGDPGGCWDQFAGQHRRVVGYNMHGRKV